MQYYNEEPYHLFAVIFQLFRYVPRSGTLYNSNVVLIGAVQTQNKQEPRNAARRISQHRVKGQHLQEFIDADKLNDEGRLEKKYQNSTSMRAAKRAKPQPESDGGSEENLKCRANASCFGKRKRLLYLSLKWVV
ncbi:hypothetical protein JOM56_010937 [Amanita muscaria]